MFKVLLTFFLDNTCRNVSRGPECCSPYHTRHNMRPHKMVDTNVKIVVTICLFLSSLVFRRKLLSVIKHHYNPLPDIYLGTTPFLFASFFQSSVVSHKALFGLRVDFSFFLFLFSFRISHVTWSMLHVIYFPGTFASKTYVEVLGMNMIELPLLL